MLQPVARDDLRAAGADARIVGLDHFAVSERFERVVAGQRTLAVRRSQVREDQPVPFGYGVPGLAHVVSRSSAAAIGLARLLEATPFGIEQPAVITATNAALFDAAVMQRRAAMHAARIQETRLAIS